MSFALSADYMLYMIDGCYMKLVVGKFTRSSGFLISIDKTFSAMFFDVKRVSDSNIGLRRENFKVCSDDFFHLSNSFSSSVP